MPLLDIQNLHIAFPGTEREIVAVDGIDLTVAPGEIVGLVGESGSGKSVTALAIMQLLDQAATWRADTLDFWRRPDEKIDLTEVSPTAMRKLRGTQLAMIFQDPGSSLNPVFRCGDQIVETLRYHRQLSTQAARQTALEWLEKVHLPDPPRIFASYPHQLSGGQQQRVMIAMAMCCEPRLLIADEPTTALDVTVQATVLDLMRELRKTEQTAILFISHDLGVVRSLADRILVMQDGHIVERNTTRALFSRAQHAYTKGLLACRPPLDRTLDRLPTLSNSETSETDTATKTKNRQTAAPNEPLLQVDDLHVRYITSRTWWGRPVHTVDALRAASFSLLPGESLGVVGESGSGKSTLAKAITGLVRSTPGSIHFAGQNLQAISPQTRRKLAPDIQIVFQNPYTSLNPRMRVGEAIREPLALHHPTLDATATRARVRQLMIEVGLPPDAYHRYPREFSGGQRQRIAIARALILEPRLLICDEAVSALDVSVQAQVLNLLKAMQRSIGFSLLFISHDLSVVRFMCERMLVMHDGRIVEAGPTVAIIESPREAYTQELIAAVV